VLDEAAAAGALRAEPSLTRMRLLQRAVVGGGVIVAGGVLLGGLPEVLPAARSKAQDVKILNLVLQLEELEAAFYADAEARGALRGELAEFARVVGEHERAHVAFLRKALGSQADPKPSFDFSNTTANGKRFAATAALRTTRFIVARPRMLGKGGPTFTDVALRAHVVLVEALIAAGWEPEGYGEEWFSERFQRANA
jgi:hypothetical protein